MLTVSLPAAEDLHHTTFSTTSWLNNFEFLSLRSYLMFKQPPLSSYSFLSLPLKNYSHSLKSKMAFLILPSINTRWPPAHLLWAQRFLDCLLVKQLFEKQATIWSDEAQHLCWSQQLEVHTWTHLGSSMQLKQIIQFWHWEQTIAIQNNVTKYIIFYFRIQKYLLGVKIEKYMTLKEYFHYFSPTMDWKCNKIQRNKIHERTQTSAFVDLSWSVKNKTSFLHQQLLQITVALGTSAFVPKFCLVKLQHGTILVNE